MAVLALGLAGSALGGTFIGGAMGSQIGWMLGSMLGNALFPPPDQEGPRLSDLKMTTSAYGQALPWVFGSARITGNLVWSTDKQEHKHSESVGKGGGQQVNTYTCTIKCFYALCQGPITGVRKIWANSECVYDASSDNAATIIASEKLGGTIRIYLGTDDQMPDPTMQAVDGVNSTPAYRGVAGVFFDDLELSKFGNSMPNLEFEVVASGPTVGARRLKDGYYNFGMLGATQYNSPAQTLYYPNTLGNYGGGANFGWALIASVNSGGMNIIQDGPNNGMPIYGLGYYYGFETLNQTSTNRWTIDDSGNFISNGSRIKEYQSMLSYWDTYDTPPGFVYGAGGFGSGPQDIERQWIGKAGSVQMYLNRYAPQKKGDYTYASAGEFYCNHDLLIVGPSPLDFDGSGLMDGIWNNTPTGHWIRGAFPSADGKTALILTGPDVYTATKWHRFSFSDVVATWEASGDIHATANPHGWGRAGGNVQSNDSGMVEEDGLHLWTTDDGVSCYEIGADGIMRRIFNQSYYHAGNQGVPSIYCIEGVAFVADLRGFSTYTRKQGIGKSTVLLSDIVSAICLRSGLLADDIDVTQLTDEVHGIVYGNQMTYRSMIDPLRTAYFFDGVERDGKLVFVKRGGAVVANIPEDALAARDAMSLDAPPDQLKSTRQQELELPREVNVNYFAVDADCQDGTQYDSIQSCQSENVVKLSLPMALTDDYARSVAMINLYTLWAGRYTYEFATDRSYAHLDPSDNVIINKDGKALTCRITKRTDGGDGVITFSAQSENPTVYQQVALGGIVKGGNQTVRISGPTEFVAFDAPPLKDGYATTPVLYTAANGYDSSWQGAALYRSFDGGDTYQDTGVSFEAPTVIGTATTVLIAPDSYGVFDEKNTVDLFLSNGASELSSDTANNVLAGFNWAMLGGELIAFKTATQIAPRQYRLSGLLRGQKGTEDFCNAHLPGESFVLLNTSAMRVVNMESANIGSQIPLKAVTFSASIGDAMTKKRTFQARNMRPLSPVRVNAYKNTLGSDWNINWTRRARTGGEWRDAVDAQLGEALELYDVEIISAPSWPVLTGASVVRTFSNLTAANVTYTTAQQTTDFGTPNGALVVNVYQVNGVVGRSPIFNTFGFTYAAPTLSGGPLVAFSAVIVDPFILMHMEEPNGSTTFTNDGSTSLTFTAYGSAQISTATSHFGSSSLVLDGTSGCYVESDTPATIANFAGNDFTIDFRIKLNSTASWNIIAVHGFDATDTGFYLATYSGGIGFGYGTGTGGAAIELWTAFSLISTGSFYNVRVIRTGGTLKLFINGIQRASSSISTAIASSSTDKFRIGGLAPTSTISGYVDEFYILNGTALNTGDFVPLTTPF